MNHEKEEEEEVYAVITPGKVMRETLNVPAVFRNIWSRVQQCVLDAELSHQFRRDRLRHTYTLGNFA
jgi:hypothetical protein